MNVIGIVADPAESETVGEFFELFKTPWEWAVPSRHYRAVLSTIGIVPDISADLFLCYGSEGHATQHQPGVGAEVAVGASVDWSGTMIPIYGRLALFEARPESRLRCGEKAVDRLVSDQQRQLRLVGYDLFKEVQHLLNVGQPASMAGSPTLELHIELLRHLLLESGVSFVEIPPRPKGYDFISCLTHDVDFFGIRRHKFDRTLAGFVARATFGSVSDLVRGRRTLRDVARNWGAVLSLPLVYLGLAKDFWRPFDDYARTEDPRRSTFFLVPFKGKAGVAPDGSVDVNRAVEYEINDVQDHVRRAAARGSELAVHGIDSWRDSESGRAELAQLAAVTGCATSGVRMHWLYFDIRTPKHLETAGFEYDSTCGYNDAIGYRAGTSQVFLMPGSRRLMELPLSIMDSAMFSRDRMGLAPNQARALWRGVVSNARRFGGTLVVNWHCRSCAPERLWDGLYRELLDEIEAAGKVWFATATEAVDWFRWRRSLRFENRDGVGATIQVCAPQRPEAPGGILRIYTPGPASSRMHEFSIDGPASFAVPQLSDS